MSFETNYLDSNPYVDQINLFTDLEKKEENELGLDPVLLVKEIFPSRSENVDLAISDIASTILEDDREIEPLADIEEWVEFIEKVQKKEKEIRMGSAFFFKRDVYRSILEQIQLNKKTTRENKLKRFSKKPNQQIDEEYLKKCDSSSIAFRRSLNKRDCKSSNN